ncbi:MAG: AraC family transcriptional regulator [Spirochaetes bacterium]|nr:AraC family transcriptional regulator [Spirochaetota bacterium]
MKPEKDKRPPAKKLKRPAERLPAEDPARRLGTHRAYLEEDHDLVFPLHLRYLCHEVFVINYTSSGRGRGGGVRLLSHPHFELIAVKKGRVKYLLRGKRSIALAPGDALLIPPFVPHERVHQSAGLVHSILFLAEGPVAAPEAPQILKTPGGKALSSLLALIDKERRNSGEVSREILTHLTRALMHLFLREIPAFNGSPATVVPRDPIFAAAAEHAHHHLRGSLSVADLARACGVGERQLARAFARNQAPPPHQYLLERKLLSAYAELINFPQASVREVGRRFAFHDANYFSKIIRRRFGRSPGAIQRSGG